MTREEMMAMAQVMAQAMVTAMAQMNTTEVQSPVQVPTQEPVQTQAPAPAPQVPEEPEKPEFHYTKSASAGWKLVDVKVGRKTYHAIDYKGSFYNDRAILSKSILEKTLDMDKWIEVQVPWTYDGKSGNKTRYGTTDKELAEQTLKGLLSKYASYPPEVLDKVKAKEKARKAEEKAKAKAKKATAPVVDFSDFI